MSNSRTMWSPKEVLSPRWTSLPWKWQLRINLGECKIIYMKKITLTWVHSDIYCIYICKCVWHTNLLCNDYIDECTKKYESHNFIVLFSKQSHCKKNLDFSYKNMLQLSKRKTISSWTVEHFQVHNRLLFTWLHWEDVQDSWSSLAQPVPAHVLQRQARFRKTMKKPGPQRQWWQVQVQCRIGLNQVMICCMVWWYV